MPILNSVATADAYGTAPGGATLSDVWNTTGGWFAVGSTNSVYVSLQYSLADKKAGRGQSEWTADQLLFPGAIGTLGETVIGIKFKSATPGKAGVVTAVLGEGPEPLLNLSALGAVPSAVAGTTILATGKVTVATAGTRVALEASSTPCSSLCVHALSSNTGLIYLGNSTVAAANGYQLGPGDAVALDISDVSTAFIDSAVNGEGVTFMAIG